MANNLSTGAVPRREPSARLRWRMLRRFEDHLDIPMALLAVVWLVIFVIEVVRGNDPLLTFLGTSIWIVFIVEFLIRLLIAPDRWHFLRHSWLTIISLIVPALRITRFASVVRAMRAARAVVG